MAIASVRPIASKFGGDQRKPFRNLFGRKRTVVRIIPTPIAEAF
jgi:hypothetical protein